MKFTFNWLKEFVTVNVSAEKLAGMFTMAGLEVESLAPLREPETNREDWLFELSVTPNRGDCLGLNGLAREVAALTGGRLKSPPVNLHAKDPEITKRVGLVIESSRYCPRYSGRVIDGLRVGPSPAWLQFRLESCGIRAINNVVDVTNYVMLETGQPLHSFDLERLPTRKIVVRPARHITKFTTLDGVERELKPEDLLICDDDTPVALAGVMGGMDSEVREETHSVLLESANFDPATIRRTAKRLALHSEASHRFERGVDPEGTLRALDRAVYLILKNAGGVPLKGVIDRYPGRPKLPTIVLREERMEKLLGVRITAKQAQKLLRSLGLQTQAPSRGVIRVHPPTSRPDLTREADLLEEIARLYGYDKIRSTLPLVRCAGGNRDDHLAYERSSRAFLAGEGFAEVINLPFTSERSNRLFTGLWKGSALPVAVLNPLARENAELRLSLLPGLVENLRLNLAQKAGSFYGYHLDKVFRLAADHQSEERQCLAGILCGPRSRRGLRATEEKPASFLDCKGRVEGILDLFNISSNVAWSAETAPILHPGRAASVSYEGEPLGYLGEIHPDVAEELGLASFLVFELDFEGMLKYAPRQIKTRSLPRFPSVERDFAVVVDGLFPSQRIVNWIQRLGEVLIEHVQVFDEYIGSPIPEGKKSLAYKVSYRADDRTLTDAEVNTLHQSLIDRISDIFGAQLRS